MTKPELIQHISEVADSALSECKSDNPLESWTMFIDLLDMRVRRRIGDELESKGKNRYTGQPLRKAAQSSENQGVTV